MLLLIDAAEAERSQKEPTGIPYKVMKSLAAVMVPAHGYVVGTYGATRQFSEVRGQIWNFVKSLLKSCAIAAAIAAGLLIYTSFTAKWKEKGYPTIPITALVAAEQAIGGARQTAIPLGGAGSTYSPNGTKPAQGQAQSRQTSLLDLEEYEG